MQIVKDIWYWLVALFPGWWKWVGIGLAALEMGGRIVSSFNPWVKQHQWVTDWILLAALFVSGFQLYRRQQKEIRQLRHDLEEPEQPKVDPEIERVASEGWAHLALEEKEAVRHLLLHDTLTNRQVLDHLQEKGISVSWGRVFNEINRKTNFVQPDTRELDNTQTWSIHPKFKEALQELCRESEPS